MAGYGTITTAAGEASTSTKDPAFDSFYQHVHPTRRPWSSLFSLSSFSAPESYAEAMRRVRHNLSYFRHNYAIVFLLLVFLGLLWHPISMIVFFVVLVVWIYGYFSRAAGPVVILNRSFDDGAVLFALSLVSVVALVITRVGVNVLVSLVVATVAVGVHAAFRGTEDLYLSSSEEGSLVSVVGSEPSRAPRARS